jgi:hypothetical protein
MMMRYSAKKNPKSLSNYDRMYNKISKAFQSMIDALIKANTESSLFVLESISKEIQSDGNEIRRIIPKTFYIRTLEPTMGYVQTVINTFKEDNRIEAILKFDIYYRADVLQYHFESFVSQNKKIDQESKEIIFSFVDKMIAITSKYKESKNNILDSEFELFDAHDLTIFNIINESLSSNISSNILAKNESSDIKIILPTSRNYDFDLTDGENIESMLGHIMNTAYNSPRFYKDILNFSWKNKHISEITAYLMILYRKIQNSIVEDIEEYIIAYKERGKEHEILKLGEYSWWLIKSNTSKLELYIGSRPFGKGNNCGADPNANYLFSLRRTDYDKSKLLKEMGHNFPFYVSEATISAKAYQTGNKKMPILFTMYQAKGPANNAISYKLWPLVMNLYSLPEVIGESTHLPSYKEYRSEFDFNTSWLSNEHHSVTDEDFSDYLSMEEFLKINIPEKTLKEYAKIKKQFNDIKPDWNNIYKSLYNRKILQNHYMFQPRNIGKEKVTIHEDGVTVHVGYLEDMLKYFDDFLGWGDKTLTKWVDMADNPHDNHVANTIGIDMAKNDYEKYYEHIESNYPELWDRMTDDSDDSTDAMDTKDTVDNICYAAEKEGYEAGTINSFYEALSNRFDSETIEEYLGENEELIEVADINKNYKTNTWEITFNHKFIELLLNDLPMNEPSRISWPRAYMEGILRGQLYWDWDFDETAALERLDEDLSNEGLV